MTEAEGCYRRRIRLVARDRGEVAGVMEDDLHHFSVRVGHADGVITSVEGETRRAPWSTCAGATAALQALVGRRIPDSAVELVRSVDVRDHCLHMVDLAALASVHGVTGRAVRVYDVTVPDGRRFVRVERDGSCLLDLGLDDMTVTAPEAFAGTHLRTPAADWPGARGDTDLEEAIFVLRRASLISLGRTMDLDLLDRAAQIEGMIGTCHTFRPERAGTALRVKGSTLDWSSGTAGMAEPLP